MKLELLRPFDRESPELDIEAVTRLRDKCEFATDLEWDVYQAKVFYEGFGDAKKAVEILQKSLERHPGSVDVLACLAECYSRLPGEEKKALEMAQQALASGNQSDYPHTIMARVFLAMNRPIDAYQSAMASLKVNSKNYEAGVYLGVTGFAIAMAEGNVEEMEWSVKNLRITQRLNPDSKHLARILEKHERLLNEAKGRS